MIGNGSSKYASYNLPQFINEKNILPEMIVIIVKKKYVSCARSSHSTQYQRIKMRTRQNLVLYYLLFLYF